MDPKRKKVKKEELNVEKLKTMRKRTTAKRRRSGGRHSLTHEEELEKELERPKRRLKSRKINTCACLPEFDNYRKRTMKEKAELILNGGERAFSSILPVVDDFERAIKTMETATDVNAVKEGVELIYNRIYGCPGTKRCESHRNKETNHWTLITMKPSR